MTSRYKDIDLSFTASPVTGDLVTRSDDSAISQSVKNIVTTAFYERPNRPEFGCGIRTVLFEPNDPFTRLTLQTAIENALANYEPRVTLNYVSLEETEDNGMNIKVNYTINSYRKENTVDIRVGRVR